MKNNDLSNQTAPILAFNADTLLFEESKGVGFMQKIVDKFKTESQLYLEREINKTTRYILEKIWNNQNVAIHLVTFESFSGEIEDYLREEDIYFTHMHEVKNFEEFVIKVRNNYMYYFDSDTSILSRLGCKHALNFLEINKVI